MQNTNLKSASGILFSLTLLLSFIASSAPAAAQPANLGLSEKVDAYILETMRRFPIPGIAVGIVSGDQVLYLHGYGTANTRGDPVTPQTPFMMQSVTKTFTALAVHQLANAGKIDLDDAVQTYIPEFRLADERAAASITVRQLLDHTSGISQNEGEQSYLQSPDGSLAEAMDRLARFKPAYQPGAHEEYSNWNYVLLGEVIARASGQPYTDYVRSNILDPLDMPIAGFDDYHALPASATGNIIAFGILAPYDEKYMPALLGASNLSASAEEMTHYLVAYFDNGQYRDRHVLSASGQGWYDDVWNWHAGQPGNISNSFSGSHNATQTNITLFPLQKVGVVVLMNARLEQLAPAAPGAWDIGLNVARITMNSPYELPDNRGFYATWAVIDILLVLLILGIVWQALRLKQWAYHYRSASLRGQVIAWIGILVDFAVCVGILLFPTLANSRWDIILYHRPDFAVPLLAIAACMGVLGFIKLVQIPRASRAAVAPAIATH